MKRVKSAWKRSREALPTAASSTRVNRAAAGSAANPPLEVVDEDRVGGQHAVELVVEEFVEALPADPGLLEDVGDRRRLVATRRGHPHHGSQQALALGAGDELPGQSVAPAWQAPLA
jgi:hypothetical protein